MAFLINSNGELVLVGSADADTLNATNPATDTALFGLAGDDIYVIDGPGDVVVEDPGSGIDTVKSSVSYTIAPNVENVILTELAKAPEYHESADLLDGLEENYRSLGVDWPANRYILITLSGDADVKGRKPMQTSVVHGWRCRYDLQSGRSALFSDNNAKAVLPASPGDF